MKFAIALTLPLVLVATPIAAETGYQPAPGQKTWEAQGSDYWVRELQEAEEATPRVDTSACTGPAQSPKKLYRRAAVEKSHFFDTISVWGSPAWDGRRPPDEGSHTMVNMGHTIQLNPADGKGRTVIPMLQNQRRTYKYVQSHFHHPSEHLIDDERFHLELHVVHEATDWTNKSVKKRADGLPNRVVIALMLKPTTDVTAQKLNGIAAEMASLGGSKNAQRTVKGFDLVSILPRNRDFFSYRGSLTTPSCDENVQWFVFRAPVFVSPALVTNFKTKVSFNARPFSTNANPVALCDSNSDDQCVSPLLNPRRPRTNPGD